MLIIVIDHENGFSGSRHTETLSIDDEKEIEEYLRREFPSMSLDNVLTYCLFIKDDKIIAEWA